MTNLPAPTRFDGVWEIYEPPQPEISNKPQVCFFVERRSPNFRLEPLIRQHCDAKIQQPLVKGGPNVILVETERLYDCLGLLRAVQYDIQQYKESLLEEKLGTEESRYLCNRLSLQAKMLGVKLDEPSSPIEVPGLDELVWYLQYTYSDKIERALSLIEEGTLEYDSLAEYFKPGLDFVDTGLLSGLAGSKCITKCRSSYFKRGKTAIGATATTFYASFECVVAVGYDRFAVVEATFSQSSFPGTRRIDGVEFLRKASTDEYARLSKRGNQYEQMCSKSTLVEYSAGSFFTSERPSRSGGRLVVDATEAWLHNIHPAKAPADGMAAGAVLDSLQAMARLQRQPLEHRDESMAGALFLRSPLPTKLLVSTWPVVCGFSLTSRTWGLAIVEMLSPVVFRESAFDELVLPAPRKRLLQALITSHTQRTNVDVLPGKGEGLIFLLYGSPGTGKTLTAEAVAEVLKLPLYRVSMGELGTTPEQLETRLQMIFDLCLPWNALVLIDEAEILLETRTQSTDLVRNAMVCVMLRIMEYFPGILFLTTNSKIDQLDPAIVSRLTCTLHYEGLDEDGRYKVFSAAIQRVKEAQIDAVDLKLLAKSSQGVNGRQIKNAVQLAAALSMFENTPLKLEHLKETLSMTTSMSCQ